MDAATLPARDGPELAVSRTPVNVVCLFLAKRIWENTKVHFVVVYFFSAPISGRNSEWWFLRDNSFLC